MGKKNAVETAIWEGGAGSSQSTGTPGCFALAAMLPPPLELVQRACPGCLRRSSRRVAT